MQKENYLLSKVIEIVSSRLSGGGKVLDLGCGDGKTGKTLMDRGYVVESCDMDGDRFEFHNVIPFKKGNLNNQLPYNDKTFDCVILMEVIEHIYNPDFVISEISRVLNKGGVIILSTPNILNIGSRLRFLFEGSFDFFREPTLDFSKRFPAAIQNMHVIPWRYQELEYLLAKNGLVVEKFFTDKLKMNLMVPAILFTPLFWLQSLNKQGRTKKKGGVDYSRINKILLSSEIMLGRHLILEGVKKAN
jgi:2-polyprenyl-3-methyl-5-hydroxy-6-metoxy-1,4-benzoquinol methylase